MAYNVNTLLSPLLAEFELYPGITSLTENDQVRAQKLLEIVLDRTASATGRTWTEFADIPPDVRSVILGVVTRVWLNPRGIVQESAGPYSATYANATAGNISFTREETTILNRYRVRPSTLLTTVSTTRDDSSGGYWWMQIPDGGVIPWEEEFHG